MVNADKLGSIIALVNPSGSVVQRFSYEPFGKLTTTSISVDSAFKYAGGYHDSATGFYKFGNRYYDSNNGVWTQRDVLAGNITDPKTMNRYVYVGGSPLVFVDPSGLFSLGACLYNSAQAAAAYNGIIAGTIGTVGLAMASDPSLSTKAGAVLAGAGTVLAYAAFIETSKNVGLYCGH